MGRPSKLKNGDLRGFIENIMLEHPDWSSRKISNEMEVKHGIKLSHATINKIKNDSGSDSIKLTKVVSQTINNDSTTNQKKVIVNTISETEFMRVESIFSTNETFLSTILNAEDVDLTDKLRAVAIRYQNAANYARVTGKGLSAEEIEKYESIISSIKQKAIEDTNRILKAVKTIVPEKYFSKIAEVL